MTDIKPNARALMDEVKREHPTVSDYTLAVFAAQRAIEQHEATKKELADFKQKVSDAVENVQTPMEIICPCTRKHVVAFNLFDHLITPKPKRDPLVDALKEADSQSPCSDEQFAEAIRAALDALGFEITEKGQ
jgi:hypothetical protein